MNYIDLHVHSNASDGTLTPTEVVTLAYNSGLKGIALTDHDSGRGIDEAMTASANLPGDFFVIPATEISCECNDESLGIFETELHILGYYINHRHPSFLSMTQEIIRRRDERNQKMVENFVRENIPMSIDALTCGNPDTIITRSHFARFLYEHGYVKKREDAFLHYLDKNGPFYVKRNFFTPKEVIQTILDAGGVPALAHPLLYHLSPEKLDALLAKLTSYGLKGLEVIYTTNTGFDESDLRKLARIHGLVMTGGSDFHGANKPKTKIGTGFGNLKIPADLILPLQSLAQNAVSPD